MLNTLILVFVGGAVGAVIRELLMLGVPDLSDGFPMSIFIANITASFLLGLATGLFEKGTLKQSANLFIGTGIMGGLSTFSSFAFGSYVLMTGGVGGLTASLIYLVTSIVCGALALVAGLKLSGTRISG